MRLTAEVPAHRFPRGLPRPDEMIVMVVAGKQTIPVRVLATDLPDCRVRAAEAGLDILLELPADRDAWLAVVAARKQGLPCSTLNALRLRPAPEAAPTIVFSYGNLADSAIGEAVGLLADVIASATIRPGVAGPAVTRAVPPQPHVRTGPRE